MMFQGKTPWKIPERSYSGTSLMVQNVYEKLTIWQVKSVHFKKTYAESSFLSKLWYFSIINYKYHNFERNKDLKMNGL